MGVFTFPAIIVVVIICIISAWVTMDVAKRSTNSEHDEVPMEHVEQHPILFNPIILVYLVVGLFMTIIIFYYWASSR